MYENYRIESLQPPLKQVVSIGNGYCDFVNNIAECNYDGGDCCSCTCEFEGDDDYPCSADGSGFDCQDPTAPCYGEGNDDVTDDVTDDITDDGTDDITDDRTDDDDAMSYEFFPWEQDDDIMSYDFGPYFDATVTSDLFPRGSDDDGMS